VPDPSGLTAPTVADYEVLVSEPLLVPLVVPPAR
jgi:hypothetical protein